jgi:serine phosphatase RsbU (regulator of sigma subunit)
MLTRFGQRFVAILALGSLAGIGGLSLFHQSDYEAGILDQNKRSLEKFLEGIEITFNSIMESGNAELSHSMAMAIRSIPEVVDFRILRVNGVEAFRDNKTIEKVNARLGANKFELRQEEHELQVLPPDDPLILQALRTLRPVSRLEQGEAGGSFYTQLAPIVAHEPCKKCHNSRAPVRGFIKMTSAMTVAEESIRKSRGITWLILLGASMGIASLAWFTVGKQKQMLLKELAAFRARLHHEIDEARLLQQQLQSQLLPSTAVLDTLRQTHGLIIEGHVEAAEMIGGDLWGVFPLGGSRVAIFAADFSGHGVSAARNTVRLQTLLRETAELGDNPSVLLTALNQHLVTMLPRGQFAAMFYGVIDASADTLLYSGCAYPPPYIALKKGGKIIELSATGLPLGIKRDMIYHNYEVNFPPGAILLIHSDGMTDSGHKEGRQLGEADIRGLLIQCAVQGEGLTQFLARLAPLLKRPLDDDLTAVWVARAPEFPAKPEES